MLAAPVRNQVSFSHLDCMYNQLPIRTLRVFVPTFHIGAAKHASFHVKIDAGHLELAVLLASRNHLRILWF